ncbi:MAG: argininosuccinate lyase [Actinobacteria bacterium]|nr:argininosuccinate lyase [Actinomycetota bacterium]
MEKIWKGRISSNADILAEKFTSSIYIDKDLYLQDIIGTSAHVIGLHSIGILKTSELKEILKGLKKIKVMIEGGRLQFESYEDIHSLVEYELAKIIGDLALKIHTGRSRNDQIVVDELLFVKEAVVKTIKLLVDLQERILKIAEDEKNTVFIAYTHMQKAQPVLLSHYLLSFFEKFKRNISGLFLNFEECELLPLGAAACVGSGYEIDRKLLAKVLKFTGQGSNSMDIVASRDFIMDYIYTCSKTMLNLSRICEDLIIYGTNEFSYIDIDESFCTGSSIMPQKKNPDILELIRGKSAVVAGNLTQFMMLFKGLPSTYNSDIQEDKKILLNVFAETTSSIDVFTKLMGKIKFNHETIKRNLGTGFIESTDCADYLTKKGESFRKAHNITGKLVRYCMEKDVKLSEMPLTVLKKYSAYFGDDFYESIKIESCLEAKKVDCGTNKKAVFDQIKSNKNVLSGYKKDLKILLGKIPVFEDIISAYK